MRDAAGAPRPVPRRARPAAAPVLAASLVAVLASGCATRGGLGRFGVRADVPEPPRVVPVDGGALAVYELQIRNGGDDPVRVERVTRSRAGGAAADVLAGDALALRVVPRQRAATLSGRLDLPPGQRCVVLLELATDAGAPVPEALHEVELSQTTSSGRVLRESLTATERTPSPDAPVVLGPPVGGDGWIVLNGPETLSGHRRAVVWLHGAPRAAQRFAIDLFRVGADGRTSAGDPSSNAAHPGFGEDVLAVADATVAAAVDGIPDNAPDPTERAVEMTGETVAGNHVVLDLGAGRFVMYAHLRRGSVAVRAGDRVVRGQTVGRLGNSGNSTEPHLHLHVADGPSPVDASGLPFVFDAFASAGRQLAGVLPSEGSVVSFPASSAAGESHAATGVPRASATK